MLVNTAAHLVLVRRVERSLWWHHRAMTPTVKLILVAVVSFVLGHISCAIIHNFANKKGSSIGGQYVRRKVLHPIRERLKIPRLPHRRLRSQTRRLEGKKTIADCFKYRNKIGIDVAVEALRTYRERVRRLPVNKLLEYARICRVEKVMRPYLEAVL
jgi:hypothetical protein